MPLLVEGLTRPHHVPQVARHVSKFEIFLAKSTSRSFLRINNNTNYLGQNIRGRRAWFLAAVGDGHDESDRRDRGVNKRVEDAASQVDAMMREFANALYINEAVSYIANEDRETTEQIVLAEVVSRHLPVLDETFLAALGVYGQMAEARKDAVLTRRLQAMKQEVLRQVGAQLPQELQLLNILVQEENSEERLRLVERAAQPEASPDGLPSCSLATLQAAACQLIDDMEEKMGVPDRRLLAKLCLIREEIAAAATRAGLYDDAGSDYSVMQRQYHKLLNQGAAAFLKELLAVSDPQRRRALLQASFREDYEAMEQKRGPTGSNYVVRPGRLLTCVTAMDVNLSCDRGANQSVLGRLEEIRREAIEVLQDLAYS
eukprot:jgi/Botrbrau1/15006/Bobra.0018s0105.1